MEKFFMVVDAADQTYAWPVSAVLGLYSDADSSLKMHFKTNTGGTADGDKDVIDMTITADKEKEVIKAILGAANATHSSGAIIIADDVTGEYIHPNLTAVAVTLQS